MVLLSSTQVQFLTINSLLFQLFTLLFSVTLATEIYENATDICTRCACTKSEDAQTLTLNCQEKGFHHILGTWPPHNGTLIANLAQNDIATLQSLPPTDAVLDITLARCNIQVLYPGVFDAAKNIRMVDLSWNFLTSDQMTRNTFVGPYHHTQMEAIKLEDLNLAHNQFHTLNKDVFNDLPNLKRLNLEGNDFVVLDLQTQLALSSVTGLESLNLADNELTELVDHAIARFGNLLELDLSNNELDFVPASLVLVGKTLEVLKLDHNPIIEFTTRSFVGLESLKELSANNLTDMIRIEEGAFAPMPKLARLSLSDNFLLGDINERAFSTNQSLRELYLNNDGLIDLSFELLDWSKLDIFEFKNNPFECSCDLYNITSALSEDITRNNDDPFCTDLRNDRPLSIKQLKSDICSAKVQSMERRMLRHHFSIPLVGLIVTLIFALSVSMSLAYVKYRRFLANKNYPFASQVVYNPLPRV